MRRRLLISARDPGAAAHLAAVARQALEDGDWEVVVFAAPPADRTFVRVGVPFRRIDTRGRSRKALEQALRSVRPDVVLAGLSGPDAGLDEALLELSEGVPRYLFQDYWGDLNPATPPGVRILCLDDTAVAKTMERHGRRGRVAGSPAHDRWPTPMRAQKHHSLRHRVAGTAPVVGLCDQPLWHLPAYQKSLYRALRLLPDCRVVVRPHPRTDWKGRLRLRRLIGESRGWKHTLWDPSSPLPAFLANCDLLLSVFSSCAFDAGQYSAHAGHQGTLSLNLLFEPEMYRHYRTCSGFERTPLADAGMAWDLRRRSDLSTRLRRALRPGVRYGYRRNQRDRSSCGGAKRVLAILRKDLSSDVGTNQ